MSTTEPLSPLDFPLMAKGQFVYRRTCSSPLLGPMSLELARELAFRLNRDEAAKSAGGLFAADLALMGGAWRDEIFAKAMEKPATGLG